MTLGWRAALDHPRAAALIAGAAMLATAGAYGLLESTETRYAEIAREMVASGDWLVPHLDGLAHFHKPPLAYWASASSMSVLGANAFAARLPAILAGVVVLLCMPAIVRRRFAPRVQPGPATWLMASMLLVAALARSLAADPFLAAAVAAFWALAPSPWALAAIGAGFLAKGPVVLVHTALPILVAALWARDRASLALIGPRRGWWLAAAVGIPWYIAVVARTHGLLSYLLVNQIWGRYASTEHQRGGPPWYFVAVIVAGAVPWTPLLIAGLARAWRSRSEGWARLLLCWVGAPLVFLSFSGSKLPAYVLPSLPAIAAAAALGLESRSARVATAVLLFGLAVAGFVFGPGAYARWIGLSGEPRLTLPWPALLALLGFALAAVALLRTAPLRAALIMTLAWTALVAAAARHDSVMGSPRRVVGLLRELRAPGEPVIEVGDFNAGVPFYLREHVRLLEIPRDTGFESDSIRAAVFVTPESLSALAARHDRLWIFGPADRTERIAAARGLRYVPVARWRGVALGSVSRAGAR